MNTVTDRMKALIEAYDGYTVDEIRRGLLDLLPVIERMIADLEGTSAADWLAEQLPAIERMIADLEEAGASGS